jgi:flagellar protein FlaG
MDVSDISPVGFAGNLAVSSGALAAQQAAERRQLLQAVKTVNESGQLGRNQLVFMVDSQTHRPIIRIEDRETHELVLQIPPEYVLRLAQDAPADSAQTTPPHADT